MDDLGAILCYISSLKDMLDQVNEEIEANIQVTREMESEIVKCTELEAALAARESDLTKTLYISQFRINGLLSVANDSRNSFKNLEEESCSLRQRREELLRRIDDKREQFAELCLRFQRDVDKAENDQVVFSEKEFLENEIYTMDQQNNSLQNSMLAFMDDVLQDLNDANSALCKEIEKRSLENEILLKDIQDLNTMLLSSSNNHSSQIS